MGHNDAWHPLLPAASVSTLSPPSTCLPAPSQLPQSSHMHPLALPHILFSLTLPLFASHYTFSTHLCNICEHQLHPHTDVSTANATANAIGIVDISHCISFHPPSKLHTLLPARQCSLASPPSSSPLLPLYCTSTAE